MIVVFVSLKARWPAMRPTVRAISVFKRPWCAGAGILLKLSPSLCTHIQNGLLNIYLKTKALTQ